MKRCSLVLAFAALSMNCSSTNEASVARGVGVSPPPPRKVGVFADAGSLLELNVYAEQSSETSFDLVMREDLPNAPQVNGFFVNMPDTTISACEVFRFVRGANDITSSARVLRLNIAEKTPIKADIEEVSEGVYKLTMATMVGNGDLLGVKLPMPLGRKDRLYLLFLASEQVLAEGRAQAQTAAAAIGDVRAVVAAAAQYQTFSSGYYPMEMSCLAAPATCIPNYPPEAPTSFIDRDLAGAIGTLNSRGGYVRRFVTLGESASQGTRFCYQAVPQTPGQTGSRTFAADASGLMGTAPGAVDCCTEQAEVNVVACPPPK